MYTNFITFPNSYADIMDAENDVFIKVDVQDEIRTACQALVACSYITLDGFSLKPTFKGIIVKTEKLSTVKAIKTMLRHWAYIN